MSDEPLSAKEWLSKFDSVQGALTNQPFAYAITDSDIKSRDRQVRQQAFREAIEICALQREVYNPSNIGCGHYTSEYFHKGNHACIEALRHAL